jgi:hypothetical protein
MRRINSWTSSLDGCISGMLRLMRGMTGNIRGHGADLLLDGVAVVMCLLDVGRTVGLSSNVDDVGSCAIEGLLQSDEEFAGRGRGHRARHVDVCWLVMGWR